jgi:CDP-diacylglycerol---serine O-phosphatidyltransferase
VQNENIMKALIRNIPNIFTLLNLTSGMAGIIFWQHDLLFSAACIFLAMVFDFADGFSARLLKATSDLGKQLDSLADIVSFGVLPACVLFGVLHPDFLWLTASDIPLTSYVFFIIPVCSALRLARFNLDESQSYGFKGLPTPANAFWIASVPFIVMSAPEQSWAYAMFSGRISLMFLAVAGSVMLLLPLPLMALKFRNFKWKENMFRYFFILLAVLFFVFFRWTSLPMIILLYVLISLVALTVMRKSTN